VEPADLVVIQVFPVLVVNLDLAEEVDFREYQASRGFPELMALTELLDFLVGPGSAESLDSLGEVVFQE
jgi:hypothetical protein